MRNRNHDKAKASLRTLYGNVEGYDVEHECEWCSCLSYSPCTRATQTASSSKLWLMGYYVDATFLSEVEFSERLRDEQKQAKWSEIFTGINGVSPRSLRE